MSSLVTVRKQSFNLTVEDLEETKKMAQSLLQTGHYQKLGAAGVFVVTQMARSIGADVMQCLNGGMYPIDGKVEMDGRMMMSLIRQAGHSVTKDKKSTPTLCILHGKRADTGDTWTESFGLEDAKAAGLLSRGSYQKYGRDMFQWRALSRLARFLFPDVIKGCYAMGEISESPRFNESVDRDAEEAAAAQIEQTSTQITVSTGKGGVTQEESDKLNETIGNDEPYRQSVLKFIARECKVDSFFDMPKEIFDKVYARALKNKQERESKHIQIEQELHQYGESSQMAMGGSK